MMDISAPNVLIILSDQHHPEMMGCAGHPILQTPNLDRLAARGTRFSNAYCQFPLCCPSRMSLMTGLYPSEMDCILNNDYLRSDIPTFAHAFSGGGYETLLCGRMHFNGPDQRHGFKRRLVGDVTWSGLWRDNLHRILGPLDNTTGPNARSIVRSGSGHSSYLDYDVAVADAAIEWLQARGASGEKSPFMMTVGFVQPHAPFVAPPEDYAYYDSKVSLEDLPVYDPETLHPEMRRLRQLANLEPDSPASPEDQRRARVAYYGMCTFMDRQVGRILSALEQSGLEKETIVVYISDHGEQLGEHGMWWKHTFYESSVGVPMVIAGPGLPRNQVNSRNVGLIDLGQTLLDLCRVPPIPGTSGQSFAPMLKGEKQEAWPDQVMAENMWGDWNLHRMIRQGPWKLNVYPGFAPTLFHLEDDPGEMCDLAPQPQYRPIIEALLEKLQAALPDTKTVLEKLEVRRRTKAWVANAFRDGDLPEPDQPWFDPDKEFDNHFSGA